MTHPYIKAALARERQNMLLAEAEAHRQARQARSHRRKHGGLAFRKPPFLRIPGWLPHAWGGLLTRRPRSGPVEAYEDV
jgi:hypothetical protein